MGLLDLEELRNLQELRELKNLDNLEQLQNAQQLEKLDNLQQLHHMQNLNQLQPLHNLRDLDKLQDLSKLQSLQDLHQLQGLGKLDNLSLLKHMRHLEELHQTDQLQVLSRLESLEKLNNLHHLQALRDANLQQLGHLDTLNNMKELSRLSQLQHIDGLSQLQNLDQLAVLSRLKILDKLGDINQHTFLYLFSFLVPGLIFQEAISFFLHDRLELKRAFVLMVAYNMANFLVLMQFLLSGANRTLLNQNPLAYYLFWGSVLLLAPFLLGWLVAALTKGSRVGRFFKGLLPAKAMASAWDKFLTDAENYRVVITLNNEEKISGFFRKSEPRPEPDDPNDLYFTETSHYDPNATQWETLTQPAGVWVKGSEIKMLEVTPEM